MVCLVGNSGFECRSFGFRKLPRPQLCQQGGGRVNTWLPARVPSFGGDVSALIGLEDLIARAAEQQAAEDSVVAEPEAQEQA